MARSYYCGWWNFSYQFAIFNPWKVPWNWISFIEILLLCYLVWWRWPDSLLTRSICQILLYLQKEIAQWLEKGLLQNRSTPWEKKSFRAMLFSFVRSVLLMFGCTINRYFTSILWICNPLGAFKDILILAKSDVHII